MDIGFDRETLRQALSASRRRAAPDWPLLHARLEAAWAARQVLSRVATPAETPHGSFDPATARMIAGFEQSSFSVNPTALGNRKPSDGIGATVAGALLAGGRGT